RLVLDALFVRPCVCHYYFGDYYAPAYRESGFVSCVVYSQRNYDSIIVYERYEHRSDPSWFKVQVNLTFGRSAGREPCPPRTFIQNTTVVQNNVYNNTYVNNSSTTTVNNINKTTTINNNSVTTNTTNNNKTYNAPTLLPAKQVARAKGIK